MVYGRGFDSRRLHQPDGRTERPCLFGHGFLLRVLTEDGAGLLTVSAIAQYDLALHERINARDVIA